MTDEEEIIAHLEAAERAFQDARGRQVEAAARRALAIANAREAGMKWAEIADVLGLDPSTVQKTMRRYL